jgi:hypothetical protein
MKNLKSRLRGFRRRREILQLANHPKLKTINVRQGGFGIGGGTNIVFSGKQSAKNSRGSSPKRGNLGIQPSVRFNNEHEEIADSRQGL